MTDRYDERDKQEIGMICPKCGGIVFQWWDSATCRDCSEGESP